MPVDKFELKKYLYYAIIFVVSMVVLIFMPMLGSDVDMGFKVPTTLAGWLIYILTKITISALNLVIFYCFMEQAKINVKDDDKYKKANDILGSIKTKDFTPLSPKKWTHKQYGVKATTLFLSSILSAFAFTNAILTYDWVSLLTYLFTLFIGVVCGILQMKSAEAYWTNEYYEYALMIQNQNKGEEECSESEIKNIETCKNKF